MELAGTVITAVLIFGFLIFIHEFGHYFFARLFKVTITEFSIGMGPKLVWYDSKKTGIRYALSMIPIGGYVAMVGEDGESDDPNAFDKKPAWQRFIITIAGATVNVIAGFIAIFIFTAMVNIGSTTIHSFLPEDKTGYEISSEDSGLMAGDRILEVDGKRVVIADELSYEIMRKGNRPIDILVLRDGKELLIEDVVFPGAEEQGQSFGAMDFMVYGEKETVGNYLKHAVRKSFLIVRMCWESIYDLITGRYTVAAVSGPVGISEALGNAAREDFLQLFYLTALISINLGVMNLLPIPALDGGRLITILIEMITRKRIPKKIEDTVNGVGLMILLGLSVLIMIKDIVGLF